MFTTKYHQQSVEYSFPGLDVFDQIIDEPTFKTKDLQTGCHLIFFAPSPTFLREVLKEQ